MWGNPSVKLTRTLILAILGLPLAPGLSANYPVSNTSDSGAGSLRDAFTSIGTVLPAQTDTITFGSLFNNPQTITLASGMPSLAKSPGASVTMAPAALLTVNSGAFGFLNLSGGGTFSVSNVRSVSTSSSAITVGSNTTLSAGNFSFDNLTLAGGTLQVASGVSGTNMALSGGGTVNVSPVNALELTGVVTGSGSLTKSGSGTLVLDGANTYTGGTTIDGGTLLANHNGEIGTFQAGTTVTVNANAFLTVAGSDALGWGNGNAKLVVNGGTVMTDGSPDQHTTLQDVTMTGGKLTESGGSNGHYFLNGPLVTNASASSAVIDSDLLELGAGWTPGTAAITVADGAAAIDLDISSAIIGNGPLNKRGAGVLRLSGSNTYLGGTTLGGGTLSISSNANLGTADRPLTFDGGALQITGLSGDNYELDASGRAVTVNAGGGSIDPGGFVLLVKSLGGSGALTLTSGLLAVNASSTFTGSLVNPAAFFQITNGANFQLGNGGTSGSISGTIGISTLSAASFDDYSTLTFNRSDSVTLNNAISMFSGRLAQIGAGDVTLTGAVSGLEVADVTGAGRLIIQSSPLGSIPSITKRGAGTLMLEGTFNQQSDATTSVLAGTLQVGNGGDAGELFGGTVAISSGATFAINRSTPLTYRDPVTGAGAFVQGGTGDVALDGSLAGFSGALGVNGSGQLIVENPSAVFAPANFVKTGPGTLVLNSQVEPTSSVQINGGVVQISGGGTLASDGRTITVASGAMLAVNRLSDSEIVLANKITGAGGLGNVGPANVRFSNAGSDFSGPVNVSGSGALTLDSYLASTLTKTGAGLLVLTQVPPASVLIAPGGTTISGGTVRVDRGVLAGSVSLAAGTTLATNFVGTYPGVISGGGGVTQMSANDVRLAGNNTFTGPVAVTGAGHLIFDGSYTAPALVKTGPGTLYLGGATTVATTTINEGTLSVDDGNGGASLSGDVSIAAGATLSFQPLNSYTQSGAISGAGGVQTVGFSSVTFTGNYSYTGPTVITPGTALDLSVADGDTRTLSGPVTIPATVDLGALRKTGAGTLVLSGDSTGSGTLSVRAGTVQLGDGGDTGSIAGNVDLGSGTTLVIDRVSTDTAVGGHVSGFGAVRNIGAFGKINLAGVDDYTGPTIIDAGRLYLNLAGAFGDLYSAVSGAGTLVKSGTGTLTLHSGLSLQGAVLVQAGKLVIASNSDSTVAGGVSDFGSGTLQINNTSGTVTLTGASSIDIALSSGRLQIGNGATTGTLQGSTSLGGTLLFNNPDATLQMVNLSGPGGVSQAGSGATSLGGTLTYSGATDVAAGKTLIFSAPYYSATGGFTKTGGGTLVIASDSTGDLTIASGGGTVRIGDGTSGSLAGNVAGSGGTLAFFRSGNVTFAGNITGPGGNLQQMGTGDLILMGDMSLTGSTTISAGRLVLGANNATFLLNTSLSGPGALVKQGTGTGTLVGLNNTGFTGAVRVEGGTLSAPQSAIGVAPKIYVAAGATFDGASHPQGNAELTGTGNVTIGNNDFQVGHTDLSFEFGGVIFGSGSFRKKGAGTVTLSGASTYGGATTVESGILRLGADGALPATTALDVDAAGTFDLAGHYQTVAAVTDVGPITLGSGALTVDTAAGGDMPGSITGTAGSSFTKAGAGTLVVTGTLAPAGTTVSAGTLQIGNFNVAGQLSGPVTVGAGAKLEYRLINNLDLDSPISGEGNLTFNGPYIVTVSTPQSLSGLTTLTSNATLRAGADGVFSSASTLDLDSFLTKLDVNGKTVAVGGLSGIGAVQLNGGQLTVDSGADSEFAGAITGTGGVTKTGPGTLTLTGSIYTGGMTVSSGTLSIGNGGTTGSIVGNIVNNAALVFNRSNTSTYTGTISGSGTLTKLGAFTLMLTGDNSYTGGTTIGGATTNIDGGTLSLGPTGFLADTGAVTVNRGTFDLGDNHSDTIGMLTLTSFYSAVSGTGTSALTVSGLSGGDDLSYIQLNSLTSTQTGDTTYAGVLYATRMILSGPGTLTLAGNFDNVDATATVNSGVLVLAKAGTPGVTHAIGNGLTINDGGAVRVGGDTGDQIYHGAPVLVNTGGMLDLNGRNEGLGELTGTGIVTNTAAGTTSILTLGEENHSSNFSGSLQDGAGSLALAKTGAGTLTLTGSNTYTGATTIDGGKLVVNGSIANSSLTTVNAGGTLGGSGTVGAVTLNAGGAIAPGNSPGELDTLDETWNGGAGYVWELNNASDAPGAKGVSYDWVSIDGTLAIGATPGGKFTIYVTSLSADDSPGRTPGFTYGRTYQWVLATATGDIANFSADKFLIDTSAFFNDPGNVGGFAIAQVGNDLILSYTAVPEPAEWGAILGAALFGAILLRRRSSSRR